MLFKGHVSQEGALGVQTVAPNSIIAWLKSPGLSGSTMLFARSLYKSRHNRWTQTLLNSSLSDQIRNKKYYATLKKSFTQFQFNSNSEVANNRTISK